MATGIVIKTSSKDWLTLLAAAYKGKTSVTLVDDAVARPTRQEILAILAAREAITMGKLARILMSPH